jgi:hypothetical protein
MEGDSIAAVAYDDHHLRAGSGRIILNNGVGRQQLLLYIFIDNAQLTPPLLMVT